MKTASLDDQGYIKIEMRYCRGGQKEGDIDIHKKALFACIAIQPSL
jgi:hypothetical protein